MNLKNKLKELQFGDTIKLVNLDLDSLITEMLDNIGSIDSELRDNLIYTNFYKLFRDEIIDTKQMVHILEICLDDKHLFYKIGEKDTDSVFTRSFSSLVVALTLEKDRELNFLSNSLVDQAINAIILYLETEKDTRGFVDGKGWAHSVAHGADALTQAIKHPSFHFSMINNCLKSIQTSIIHENVLIDDEDERLLFAIDALLDKGLEDNELAEWIKGFTEIIADEQDKNFSISFFRTKTNIINFLKSLYFRLVNKGCGKLSREVIEGIMEKEARNY